MGEAEPQRSQVSHCPAGSEECSEGTEVCPESSVPSASGEEIRSAGACLLPQVSSLEEVVSSPPSAAGRSSSSFEQ